MRYTKTWFARDAAGYYHAFSSRQYRDLICTGLMFEAVKTTDNGLRKAIAANDVVIHPGAIGTWDDKRKDSGLKLIVV